jgi:hypothetical protein
MDGHEGFLTNRSILFDEKLYALWSIRMQTYLMDIGFDIFQSVMIGYTTSTTPPEGVNVKNLGENNPNAMNSILCGLLEFKFVKVMHCGSKK